MADAILGHSRVVGKPMSFAFNTTCATSALLASANLAEPTLVDGVVRHDYVDPDVQVTILAIVDETGSATIADIVSALPGHPKPAGAALAMVRVGILRIDSGIVDAHTRLCRALPPDKDDDDDGETPDGAMQPRIDGPRISGGIAKLEPALEEMREIIVPHPYAPAIFCVTGTQRGRLRSQHVLHSPGIYAAFWGHEVYVGASKDVVTRVTKGQHLLSPRPADRIIAIADRTGQLDWDGAQVAERLFHRRLTAPGALVARNEEPSGGHVGEAKYKHVHDLVDVSMDALRREGLVSPVVPETITAFAKDIPRSGQTLFATKGEGACRQPALYRLQACGVEAQARVDDKSWTLLAGSAIRGSVMPSAHPSARQRRVELLHSGGLVQRGVDYLLTRDLQFGSATGAAHFVVGSKTRADIWSAVDVPHPQSARPS